MDRKENLCVFLSGRLDTNWRQQLMSEIPSINYYDPAMHKLDQPSQYTIWDMHFVKSSDLVFGYMDKSNPSGYGLAVEIGYAKGLGKTVILVDEKSDVDNEFSNYFSIVRSISDMVVGSLDEGIALLKRFVIKHGSTY